MFKLQLKLKPGNVFQKINKMDKKQAYTWGAIIVVCFIALVTLASFMGDAEDTSFDDFNTRGYDLAQMPFVNDEAEDYLLASKYPDMQNNGATMLYSQEEKEARQEADAEAAMESGDGADDSASSADSSASYRGYSGSGYSGRGGAGAGTPTQVGQLGSASIGHAGGSGMSGSFGAPRGDFSPYKSQEKGSEIQYQLKNTDARKALSQFAQTSRAAAGLRDNKNANAKRALMGGSIKGSEAFTDSGVDLSKTNGLALDTNAPVSSADLSNLDKAVSDAANKGKDDKDDFLNNLQDTPSFWEQLGQNLLMGFVNAGVQAGIGAAFDGLADARANYVGNRDLTDALNKNEMWTGKGSATKNLDAIIKQGEQLGWTESDIRNFCKNNPDASTSDLYAAAPKGGSRSARQSFAKDNVPAAYDVYTTSRANSRENNFFAGSFADTFQGVFSSSVNQAMSNTMGGGNGGGYNYNYNSGSSSRRSGRSAGSSSSECITACKDYSDQDGCYKRCMGR